MSNASYSVSDYKVHTKIAPVCIQRISILIARYNGNKASFLTY